MTISGVHNYLYKVGHELGHKWDIENGLLNRKFRVSDDWNKGFDADGDGLVNDAEMANGLDPLLKDTTHAFGGSLDGDKEVLACIHGLAKLLPNKDAWHRDWSSAGLQYAGLSDGNWGPYCDDPAYSSYWGLPVFTPYFPWCYQHQTYFGFWNPFGPPSSNPPANAVTQVVNPFSQPPYTDGKIPYPGSSLPVVYPYPTF